MKWFLKFSLLVLFLLPVTAQAQYYIKRNDSGESSTAPKIHTPYYPKKQSITPPPSNAVKIYSKKKSPTVKSSSSSAPKVGTYTKQCSAELKDYVEQSYAAFMDYLEAANNPANAAAMAGKPKFGDYGDKDKDTLKYIANMRTICTMETVLYGPPTH